MAVVTCPACGTKNRVDESRAASSKPVCGKCGRPLETSPDQPIEVTDSTLDDLLASAGQKPVLIDCWAQWCGPCRMIAPTIDQLAREANGRWVIAKLNVDENQRTAAKYHIDSIPALLVFKSSQLIDKLVGVQPKEAIARRLASV